MNTIITADRKTRLIATQIEVDLRRWIQKELLVQKKFKDLVNEETYSSCKALCIKRKKSMDDLVIENQVYDEELLEFISFATSLEILKKNKNLLDVSSKELLEMNYDGFVFAKDIRNSVEHGRVVTPNEEQNFSKFCEKITKNLDLFPRTTKEIEDLNKGIENEEDYENYIDEREEIHNLPLPEWEDTGWVERKDLNIQLKKKLRNNNVISFIGDAGSGKTALAVKKCYEYLNGKIENDFEAIMYHSFKTEKFSKGEIIDLQNNLNTTEKFFKSLAIIDHHNDPIKNLIRHLEDNKVLLLLDNLENVLDNQIINFLELFSEAEHNSKIFITSRVPIGHGDISIKVGPFSDKEALDYFERLSKYLQIERVTRKLDLQSKKKLTNDRFNNPLYIKLALNAVADGSSLTEAFRKEKDLLNFSYLTIYNKLNILSKRIVGILFTIKQELTLSSICDLLENENPDLVSQSIKDLIRKNILVISFKKTEAEYYNLRKEVIPFIEKNKFFEDKKNNQKILNNYTKLNSYETLIPINLKEIKEIPEAWDNYLCRKKSDRGAISKLQKATNMLKSLKRSNQNNFAYFHNQKKDKESIENEIKEIFKNLKSSHQDFCEVYRVEGQFYEYKHDLVLTKKAFETAITLQPDYPNIYNYYSSALKSLQDIDGFKENAKKAALLFPENGESQLQYMVLKVWINEFDDEINEIYKKVELYLEEHTGSIKIKRKVGMQLIRFYASKCEFYLKEEDFTQSLEAMQQAYNKFYYLEKKNLVDIFTTNMLKKTSFLFPKLKDNFRGREEENIINKLHDSLTDACTKYTSYRTTGSKLALIGSILNGIIYIDRKIKGGFIHLENSYFVELGQEKTKLYVPFFKIPKNIKDGSKIQFKLSKFQHPKTGKFSMSAVEMSPLL